MADLSAEHNYFRSSSRRRRSTTDEHEGLPSKYPRSGHHGDVRSYQRQRRAESLCDQCRSIDLNRIISSQNTVPSFRGQFVMYLDFSETAECALCQFLAQMRIPHPRTGNCPALGGGLDENRKYHLRAFSGRMSYREYFLRPSNREGHSSGDMLLAVVPNGLLSDRKGEDHYADTFGQVGYICPVAYSSRAPWLTARPIKAMRVNFPLLQSWLDFCRKNHECSMKYSRPDKLNVIDCNTMKIVTAPKNCNYLALSYVWGKPQCIGAPSTNIVTPHSEMLSNLAPVVRDAVEVVKGLGKRYLWVDKYCIAQSDPEIKSYQIRTMDLIYEGAFCTIVAAAGNDDQYGLPGIGRRRRRQPSLELGASYFVSTLPDPRVEIKKSQWVTRAWTYQEALCSARRLIFTEHQVYFECKVIHCRESVDIPLTMLHSHDRKRLNNWVRPVMFKDEWLQGTDQFGPSSAYWSVVKNYSTRQMTYDSDALNALDGILRRFQAKPSFNHNILGIPLKTNSRDNTQPLLNQNLFISSLSWHHTEPPRRRNCFPSWTWAGWEGHLGVHRNFGSDGYETDMRLWIERSDGQRVAWSEYWKEFWTNEGKERCLAHFSCLYVEATVFKVQLSSRSSKKSPSNTSQIIDIINPYNGFPYSTIQLPRDLLESSKVKTDLWDCILLGRKAKVSGPDIMLIQWSGDTAERVWAGTLFLKSPHLSSLDAHLPPGMRRRFRLK